MPGTKENPDMSVKETLVSIHQSFRVCKGIKGEKGEDRKMDKWRERNQG